jgi:excisionase family DNA binding protein
MLDVREAARLAGRTPETVRRWVWSGRIPAVRQGNRLLVARRDVDNVVRGVSPAQEQPSLADWASLVDAHRRGGALPRGTRGSSAADLVVADRSTREDR